MGAGNPEARVAVPVDPILETAEVAALGEVSPERAVGAVNLLAGAFNPEAAGKRDADVAPPGAGSLLYMPLPPRPLVELVLLEVLAVLMRLWPPPVLRSRNPEGVSMESPSRS